MQGKVYVITVFLATVGDTYMKTSSFYLSRKLIPTVNSNSRRFHSYSSLPVGMCYRPEIILYELQTQAAL